MGGVFQVMDVGGEFRDVVEDGGGPGGFHALADGGLHAGEFIGRDGGVFFLGQRKNACHILVADQRPAGNAVFEQGTQVVYSRVEHDVGSAEYFMDMLS